MITLNLLFGPEPGQTYTPFRAPRQGVTVSGLCGGRRVRRSRVDMECGSLLPLLKPEARFRLMGCQQAGEGQSGSKLPHSTIRRRLAQRCFSISASHLDRRLGVCASLGTGVGACHGKPVQFGAHRAPLQNNHHFFKSCFSSFWARAFNSLNCRMSSSAEVTAFWMRLSAAPLHAPEPASRLVSSMLLMARNSLVMSR